MVDVTYRSDINMQFFSHLFTPFKTSAWVVKEGLVSYARPAFTYGLRVAAARPSAQLVSARRHSAGITCTKRKRARKTSRPSGLTLDLRLAREILHSQGVSLERIMCSTTIHRLRASALALRRQKSLR
jgi:hypothetical protein